MLEARHTRPNQIPETQSDAKGCEKRPTTDDELARLRERLSQLHRPLRFELDGDCPLCYTSAIVPLQRGACLDTTLIVLVDLKEGVSPKGYESWARDSYAPVAKALPSIRDWRGYRVGGLLISDALPPINTS